MPKAVQMVHILGEIVAVLSGSNNAEQPIWCAGQYFQPEKEVLSGLQLITVVMHPCEAERLRQHSTLIQNSDRCHPEITQGVSESTSCCFSLWGERDRCTI